MFFGKQLLGYFLLSALVATLCILYSVYLLSYLLSLITLTLTRTSVYFSRVSSGYPEFPSMKLVSIDVKR